MSDNIEITEKQTYKRWADVPANLKTRTQLREAGLRPARGQQPAAMFDSRHGDWKLYDSAQAVPVRVATEAQKAALEAGRLKADRLRHCGSGYHCFSYLSLEDYGDWKRGRIRAALRDRGEDLSKADHQYICRHCKDRQRAAEWAREVLADPGAVILDTETTGLDETAEIIEIAVIRVATGEPLFESFVKPYGPMGATHIHGITAEDVAGAPGWGLIDSAVTGLLSRASRVIIYNADYDRRLIDQSRALWGMASLGEWSIRWQCAMEMYARWNNDYSSHHKSYRWVRLAGGGHRALGDCLACLEYIKRMAKDEE